MTGAESYGFGRAFVPDIIRCNDVACIEHALGSQCARQYILETVACLFLTPGVPGLRLDPQTTT